MEPQCSLGWDTSSLHLCWELRLSHSSSKAKPDPESRSARSALILKPTDGTPLSIHWLSKERSSWSTWGTRNAKQPTTGHFRSPSVSKNLFHSSSDPNLPAESWTAWRALTPNPTGGAHFCYTDCPRRDLKKAHRQDKPFMSRFVPRAKALPQPCRFKTWQKRTCHPGSLSILRSQAHKHKVPQEGQASVRNSKAN